VVEVFSDAIDNAKAIDAKFKLLIKDKNTAELNKFPLLGAVVVIKDNMLYDGHKATCASGFLKNYVSQYTATCVQRLIDAGAVILGRANMDEFAMGSSNEKSYHGLCKNALDETRVPGGSSGGSASAVAADLCSCALGSDTGGSVRLPASFNGVCGMKPTYGRVSRFGVIAFASSLDQVGPITKTVEDNALLLSVLNGEDANDQTALCGKDDYYKHLKPSVRGLKVGKLVSVYKQFADNKYHAVYEKIFARLKEMGAEIVDCDVPLINYSINAYYIIAPAEAASNLARFDGIKYTTRSKKAASVGDIYEYSRTEGFGEEVKRRIMIGNFVLSTGYADAYYNKAKQIQSAIKSGFTKTFEKCDVLILPTSMGEAFKIGEFASADPARMYLEDIFTVPANIAGVPALSIPCGTGENNLPLGLQIYAKSENEQAIYNFAMAIEGKL